MNRIILSVILLLNFNSYFGQSCCSEPSSTEAFATLTQDEKFVATHLKVKSYNADHAFANQVIQNLTRTLPTMPLITQWI